MRKRIISLLMALVLICSCCFTATTAHADDIDSTLTLVAASSTAKKIVFTGTDSIDISSTVKKFKASAADEGIFVNSVKDDSRAFAKKDGNWIIQLASNAATDTIVTAKGTFTYDTTSVTFATITVKYNGSAWEVIDNPAEGGAQVNLESTYGWATCVNNDNWVLYLNTSGYTSTDWSKKYQGFNYEINGVTGTTSQVSSTEDNRLYCTIPTSMVPTTEGTTFTIKAGTYTAEAGTSDNLVIAKDFDIVVSEGRLVHTKVIDAATAEVHSNSNAEILYFALKDSQGNAIDTGYASNDNFLSPLWCDITRVEQNASETNNWSSVNGGVFVDGTPVNYWNAYFKQNADGNFCVNLAGLTVTSGTTVTVRGHIGVSTVANWTIVGHYYLQEMSFTYDGTVWNFNAPVQNDEVTLTSTYGWATCVSGDNWVLYINTSGYTSTDWSKKYQGFTYEINGVTGTTGQVSSTEDNRLYCTIPVSAVPTTDGTVFTIKAGTYAPEAGTRDNLVITDDFDVVVSEGRLLHTTVIDAATAEVGSSDASTLYFTLKDSAGNAINTGCASDGNFLSPAWCDVTRIDPSANGADIWSTVYSGVFVNGEPINYWNAYFKQNTDGQYYVYLGDFAVTAGTTVTIKGHFAASTTADWTIVGNYFLQELKFTYDGSAWSYVDDAEGDLPGGEPTITEHTGTPTYHMGNTNAPIAGFYFVAGETTFPYDTTWGTNVVAEDAEDSGVFLNGEKTSIVLKKTDPEIWYVCISDAGVTPSANDIITIKGAFAVENDRITFTEAQFIWDGTKYSAYTAPIEYVEYAGEPVFWLSNGTNGFYFNAGETAFPYDAENWSVTSYAENTEGSGVFLNGEKTEVFLKKVAEDAWYVCLSDASVTPQAGDVITVKGSFIYNNEHRMTFTEAKFIWDGTVWGEEVEVDEENIVFTLDRNMSSGVNGIYLNATDNVPYDLGWATNTNACAGADNGVFLNGTKTSVFLKKYEENKYYVCLSDVQVVPQEGDTVTVKGAFKTNDYVSSYKEYTVTYKNGRWLDASDMEQVPVKESNVKLTLDKETFGWTAGTEVGIYLFTDDNFAVDSNWRTPIYAVAYDDNSGIFFNGKKVPAYLKKHAEGMIYLDIAAADIFAKDGDKVTIKGIFALDEYGVSYAEQSFYFNGQSWGTTYTEPIEKSTTKLNIIGVKKNSGFNAERKAWDIYVQVDNAIPGGHDYEYRTLVYEVNGKSYETSVYRVDDSLVFFVPETIVPKDAKDGTAITLKAGTASDNYGIYDIVLTKDATAYVYRKAISGIKPTEDTPYLNITIPGLIRTWSFNEDIKEWQLFFIVEEKFDVEDDTRYLDLPVKLNGKSYDEIYTFRSGECLYISIPESVLPRDAKEATLTIAKGAKAVANAGWNGIRLNNEVNAYLFGGVWNNIQFTDYEDTDVAIHHLNFTSYNPDAKRWDVYVNVNTQLPGSAWFEMYEGLTVYLNGKEFTTYANKAEYVGDRLLYIALPEETFGKFHEGDIVYIPGDQMYTCGGYRLRNVRDYYLKYVNGTWFECYESDVKAPEAMDSVWEKFRIDGYIPVQEEQGIMFTNIAPTNVIKSTEDMKDVTFTFETKKMMAMNEELPTNSFVLRGQPLNEQMDISETALYGYNISFGYIELTEANSPNNPELWGTHSQQIEVWKNGINYNLLDQYRMTYNWQKTNHPFFKYDETYKYTVSIYNVEEDVCVIEVYCNDELIMSVVDHASDDPMDPARNAGEFQIYAACPQYFNATPVELDTLAASSSECYIGEQVRVSATYPAILEGSEYTVDSENATLKDGVFTATKPGTYTVSGTYNGVDKGTVQIKVSEKPLKNPVVEDTSTFPVVPVAIGGGVLLVAAAVIIIVSLKKKNKKESN